MIIKEATINDIPVLARQHIMMFEEICEYKEEKLDIDQIDKVENAYIKKLESEMPDGICKAWKTEDNNQIIAGGAVSFINLVPNPHDLSTNVAFVHSIYTDKNYRNKKCAQQIVNKIIDYCKSIGVKRILLNASDAGKPVYEKLGFQFTHNSMMLIIK